MWEFFLPFPSLVLSLRIGLPEHISPDKQFALRWNSSTQAELPSFALRVEAVAPKNSPAAALLETPVFFPYFRASKT